MAKNVNMPGEEACRVQNVDCQGLCNRASKYAIEMLASASQYVGALITSHDMTRYLSYLTDLETFINTVQPGPMDVNRSHNQIDFPLYPFPAPEKIQKAENETLKSVASRLLFLWTETANCQSTDMANGFIDFDANRFLSIINDCRNLLANLPNPVDLPEIGQEVRAPGAK